MAWEFGWDDVYGLGSLALGAYGVSQAAKGTKVPSASKVIDEGLTAWEENQGRIGNVSRQQLDLNNELRNRSITNDFAAAGQVGQGLRDMHGAANPELYGAANRISGMQVGPMSRLGGLYGEAAQAGSGLNNRMSELAMQGLQNPGQLSARDVRDVSENARAAFNDRGRVRDTASVVREMQDNEQMQRIRRNEAWGRAGQAENFSQGYNLANMGAQNQMTSQNLGIANQRDMYNSQLQQQDFDNQLRLNQMGYNAWAGLQQDPMAFISGRSANSSIGVGDAVNLNNNLMNAGMNANAQRNAMWGNIAGGALSGFGNYLGFGG